MTKKELGHESRVLLYTVLAGLPGSFVALLFLWTSNHPPRVQWTLTILILIFWLGFALALRGRIAYPLQTISNLLAALREGDYSIRMKKPRTHDSLYDVITEVNELGETLREQRLGALEATALLSSVMGQIEVAIFAFDHNQILRLVNRAGERLLAQPEERLIGRTAEELNLAECLEGEVPRTIEMIFPGGVGRWEMHRSTFRQGGLPHELIVLSDLSRALREEERQAWQRIIRVLGHELNNSLAPIKSIAGSLENLLNQNSLPGDWKSDTQRGLSVIGSRAEALSNFMQSYANLARLPQPKLQPLEVGGWIRHVARLETRMPVEVEEGSPITIQGDRDQLEQLLINLIRNAVDASSETGGKVRVGWSRSATNLEVWVEDEGPGIANPQNVFVPFFTTKPGGSGIGLVLCRQIAEAHGGRIALENRIPLRGARARLFLPL
jgi:two-component system, NtrC family, nitrogen regulation sensor histidine kinase NtrY